MERHWFFFWSVDGIFTLFFFLTLSYIVYTRRCYALHAAAAAAAVDVDITGTDFRAALCCSSSSCIASSSSSATVVVKHDKQPYIQQGTASNGGPIALSVILILIFVAIVLYFI